MEIYIYGLVSKEILIFCSVFFFVLIMFFFMNIIVIKQNVENIEYSS